MVTVVEAEIIEKDGKLYLPIPENWPGLEDRKPLLALNDIILVIPQYIANATGELLMIRLIEGLLEARVIRADDIQKAVEHFI